MGSNHIIVKEYLESLKEDAELDYLFPILLTLMGFKIVTTAKEYKGQPQYGKDIVAVGRDDEGVKKRFYFELKGYADKDIDQTSFLKKDGIRESILEAKETSFEERSIPGFDALPVQVVVVHNGLLKSSSRKTFNDFIDREFPDGGFERWDIYRLTDLFTEYLFGEYLFTDEESIALLKRTIVLLDAPDYDLSDFIRLVELQIEKITRIEGRSLKKFFASMNLVGMIVVHYAYENNNLLPAKKCIGFLLMRVWRWILENKLEKKRPIKREYAKLVGIYYNLLDSYLKKTEPARLLKDGLFSEQGGLFEIIGYPIRSLDYIFSMLEYFEIRLAMPKFDLIGNDKRDERLLQKYTECLILTLNNNKGFARPLLDNHSIPLMGLMLFLLRHEAKIPEAREIVAGLLTDILSNILVVHHTRGTFPEMHNNMDALVEFAATHTRPHEYKDSSTLLITILFEMVAVLDLKDLYDHFRGSFDGKINLQMAHCDLSDEELELLLFSKNLHREMHVETNISLPEEFADFRKQLAAKAPEAREYKTDGAGFAFLRLIAHKYFANEFFVNEWRRYLEFSSNDEIKEVST